MKNLFALALTLAVIQMSLADKLHLSAKNPHPDKVFEMLKSKQHIVNEDYLKSIAKLQAYSSPSGPPSTPTGISTTDNWSAAEIIVATLGGFVALLVGATLWSRYSSKKKGSQDSEEEVPMLNSNPEFLNF